MNIFILENCRTKAVYLYNGHTIFTLRKFPTDIGGPEALPLPGTLDDLFYAKCKQFLSNGDDYTVLMRTQIPITYSMNELVANKMPQKLHQDPENDASKLLTELRTMCARMIRKIDGEPYIGDEPSDEDDCIEPAGLN